MTRPLLPPDIIDSTNEDFSSRLGQNIADIIRREGTHEPMAEKLLCIRTPYGQAIGCNSDDRRMLDYMVRLRQLYARLMASDEPPVEATFGRRTRRKGFKLTTLGKQVLLACTCFGHREKEGRNWQQAYANHRFHPVIAVMLRAVIKWWSPIYSWDEPTRVLTEDEPETVAVEALHQLVGFVRRVCRSQAFQNRLHDHERQLQEWLPAHHRAVRATCALAGTTH